MPRLTDQEQQEIIRYIEADKPLPDKYRFRLFEDKREVDVMRSSEIGKVLNTLQAICQQLPAARTAVWSEVQTFVLVAR